ncbi:hypothetical protein IWQ60_007999 [Tieghemiomyces parasiticus]|uniref:Amine oxidase domain-containing protein n=1 Tax=Tieghemiomyces parasiticus TaxID=78921 RepID=A0A9W7ZYF1_9FUNG|nr:hypothetical protein IWQ60_007999 [Tieghemiomyces parasiticus]
MSAASTKAKSKRIAIVGSGVSGLGAAWLLSQHSPHSVTLYEKEDYVGGHTHTVMYQPPTPTPGTTHTDNDAGQVPAPVPVDTGFIVYNCLTYPNLINFFKTLDVATEGSDMSFALSRDSGRFEWAGSNLTTLFAQVSNLWRPEFWRMLYDVIRFNHLATDLLSDSAAGDPTKLTIGEYLDRHGYSEAFRRDYLIPMTAAVWSTPMDKCALAFPAYTLIKFMHNHCLLNIINQPQWRTVTGGSWSYVRKVVAGLRDIRTGTAIVSIVRRPSATTGNTTVEIVDSQGRTEQFDHVVLSTHADQSLAILGDDATPEERALLSSFQFTSNHAVLHADSSLMPARRAAWSSWNYLMRSADFKDLRRHGQTAETSAQVTKLGGTDTTRTTNLPDTVSLTYWMNRLQNIPEDQYGPILISLNPLDPPRPELTLGQWDYTHPLVTPESVAAQARLAQYQAQQFDRIDQEPTHGDDGGSVDQDTVAVTTPAPMQTSFCGAWTKYGFHEDGLTSGLNVATALGATCPFEISDATHIRDTPPPSSALLRGMFAALNLLFANSGPIFSAVLLTILLTLAVQFYGIY